MADPGARELRLILKRLEETHDRLIRLIAATAADVPDDLDGETYLQDRLAEVDRLIIEARKELADSQAETVAKIAAFIAAGVAVGVVLADAELVAAARAGATVGPLPGVPGSRGRRVGQATQATRNVNKRLAKQAAGDLAKVHTGMLRQVGERYRSVVAEAAREITDGGMSLKEAVGKVSDRFAKSGITGLVDRAGRRWRPESYAEMALRTTYARAANEGKISRFQERGQNFLIVSSSSSPCSACAAWQGVILVIDGPVVAPAESTLADAESSGLFHPNCTHSISSYVEGFSERPEPTTYDEKAYAESQTQRRLERETREARRRVIAAKAAGVESSKAEALVERRSARLTLFLAETGRKRRIGADLIPGN